jgi:Tfp pilus assembly protein PilX
MDSSLAELKDGTSAVVCENGRLIKVSKDQAGVVTKEILTKTWTDWVDYLQPALDARRIEMTCPDAPRSSVQRYRRASRTRRCT